ncbi:MAG TPA: hypothetical protein VK358_06040, partial [Longimicrobium sp.]|nr:hypothetical protein [Longimicrobium sp.]
MRFANFGFYRSSGDAPPPPGPVPGPPPVTPRSEADSTLVVDAENGWAIGTAADLTEVDGDPVHNVLKRTEVWFGYKAAAVEKEAREMAAVHADKGQPRHDLPRTEPLEMELVLEQRAREVLSGWMDRVHRQLQGAVAAETEALGNRLAAARRAVANAAAARALLGPRAPLPDRVLRIATDPVAPEPQAPDLAPEEIHAERHLESRWFWPLMALLMMADFFANHPVFVELFPANHLLDQGFAEWEEGRLADGLSTWHGVATMFKRALVYPEPSILAGVVVLLLLFLGHTFGGHLRTLVVVFEHRRDQGSAANAHAFRQSAWSAGLSFIGFALIVGMLGVARGEVLPAAEERLAAARQELAAAEASLAADSSASEPEVARRIAAVSEARGRLDQREERRSYAAAIDRMNFAIAGLNLALVLAATLAGYLREERRFSALPQGVPPHVADRVRRHAELSAEFAGRRDTAHQALDEVRAGMLRVEHLLAAELLRD